MLLNGYWYYLTILTKKGVNKLLSNIFENVIYKKNKQLVISKTFYRKEQHIYGFMCTHREVYKRFKYHLHKITLDFKEFVLHSHEFSSASGWAR